jgi:hypothetical protein
MKRWINPGEQTQTSHRRWSFFLLPVTIWAAHVLLRPNALAQTWQMADDFQYASGKAAGNYGLCVAPSGTLFAAGYGLDASGISHALVMASSDTGQTWSDPLDDFTYPGISATRYDGGIVADAAGNLYATGRAYLNHTAASRWFVRRSSDNGLTWTTVDDFSLGGARNEPHAIAADAAGNIYIAGLASTSTASYGIYEWVVRKGINGTAWSTVDDFGPNTSSEAFGVLAHPTAGVFVAGSSIITSGKSTFSAWTVRSSLDGGATWQTVDTFQLANTSLARSVGIDPQGNLYVVGSAFMKYKSWSYNHWIVRRSANGGAGTWNTADDFQLNSTADSVACGFASDSLGNLFVAGPGSVTHGGPMHWLVRKHPGGLGTWSTVDNFQYVQGNDTEGQSIASNAASNVFVGGFGNDASGVSHWLIRRQ